MSDRNDRSDRLRRRLDDDPATDDTADADVSDTDSDGPSTDSTDSEGGETPQSSSQSPDETPSKPSQSSKPSSPSQTAMPEEKNAPNAPSVKDRPSVLMYLPAALRQEMDIRFDEVNAAAKREFGEGLEKNRHWYPFLLSLALEKTDEMSTEELLTRLDETEN